ncbi:hypothetical protein N7478_007841 [Penicillium angulare]|uniref:uncharacterized protein n=1 Tax=Penicillium angulare TaxID=116970 RepID=UPI002541AC5F|nr:uncharacterized protein N7478_007841 [Penicillium angulare]KAJ5272716.1 hypothetical protein N7478_007841 [Penicillium angulare]
MVTVSPIVFVCGATGTQGNAVAHNLLEHGIEVRSITRNINSPQAKRLLSKGIFLSEGDFNDKESLKKTMTNCTAIFLNLSPDHGNPTGELNQARTLISAAKEAGIKHIVYTSALATNNPERLTHWDPSSIVGMLLRGKQAIENEVKNAGFENWTILRPGNFMSNFLSPLVYMYQGLVQTKKFTTAFLPDTILPMIDPNDIGKFAAASIIDPVKFNQQEINTVSQMINVKDLINDLSQSIGEPIQITFLSEEDLLEKLPENPLLGPQKVMRDMSLFVDMEEVKKWGIKLGTFVEFLEREKERVNQTYM